MHLWAEDRAEMPVLEHRRRDAGVDPEELLGGIDLHREGHAVSARKDTHDHVDAGLGEHPLGLVDGHVGLALGVGIGRLDLVTRDAAALVDHVARSEEHTSELQSLMRISYTVFCFKNT